MNKNMRRIVVASLGLLAVIAAGAGQASAGNGRPGPLGASVELQAPAQGDPDGNGRPGPL
ncbi:hypothetical protein Lesp02_53460 [Lentzea sp. NBRC 105346]|uniref:hypothetical protein n=1 Tax=Lentzea sp. NBRC 105346 TaxID=3032205 RepID=UPI0024A48D0F|nr:hypothetical protein [Lentzea sp. NBRC 105346]GLZ33158.1 hypothetical protein Lesp02_53460 [Lentzea sp. NBRC 105346]